MHHRRRRIGGITQFVHLLACLQKLRQAGGINFGCGPVRMQHLQPIFFLQHAQDMQRILFVRQLLDFIPDCFICDVFDVVVFSRRIEPLLRALFQWPVKARCEARCPDEPRWIFHKCVIVQNAEHFGFNIRRAIEGVHQQAA